MIRFYDKKYILLFTFKGKKTKKRKKRNIFSVEWNPLLKNLMFFFSFFSFYPNEMLTFSLFLTLKLLNILVDNMFRNLLPCVIRLLRKDNVIFNFLSNKTRSATLSTSSIHILFFIFFH